MLAYNMDDLKKYNKRSVRDIVLANILSKKDIITNATLESLITKHEKIVANKKSSKAMMIRLNNKVNEYKAPFIPKVTQINQPQTIKPILLSANKLKQIKKEEQKMIDVGRAKLKNFLKDSHQVVSFFVTVYLPKNPAYKGSNSFHYDGLDWTPLSKNTHGDLRSFFLEKEAINFSNLYNSLKKINYIIESEALMKHEYYHYAYGNSDGFRSIIRDFVGFDNLDSFVYQEAYCPNDEFLLKIDGLSVKPINKTPTNYVDDKAYDDASNMFLSNAYIKVNTNTDIYTSDYVKKNFKSRSCWLSLLLDVYKKPFDKYYTSTKLTYESIHAIIGDCPMQAYNNGYSFKQVVKFFKKYKLNLYMFDIAFNLVAKHVEEKPNNNIRPTTMYVIFHNGHIYHVNDNLNSLSKKLSSHIDKPVVYEPSDKYYLSHQNELENDTQIIDNYDDLVKIIENKKITGTIHLIYQNSCFDLWFDLLKKMKYEASIKMRDRKIDFSGLSLKNINDKNIIIKSYSEKGMQVNKEFGDSKMFHTYIEKQNNFCNKLLNKNYISKYSPQVQSLLKDCGIGGLMGYFEDIYEKTDVIEIDYNKFYTSLLRDIENIPVINSFDNFINYDGHEIKDYSLYYVEKKNCDIAYPINHFSLCYGMNIKDMLDELHIIAFLEPSKLKTNISGILIKEVFDDETLTETMKKNIVNHCIGRFHKSYNKNTFSCASNNIEEANKVKQTHGGHIIPLEDAGIYLNYVEMKTEITDGFKLLSHMIYDIAHKRLFNLKKKVESYDLRVVKCNTDCLWIAKDSEKFDLFYNDNKDLFDVSAIGKLKIEEKIALGGKCLAVKRFIDVYQPVAKQYKKEVIVKDEWDREEMKHILDNNKNLVIKADIAGAGKTNAFVHYCKENKISALFICPWNSLCFNLKSKGNDALTLDKVVGLRFDGANFKQTKEVDIEEYEMVVFDEIFLYDTYKLQCIKEFMHKHSGIRFYATGDEHQNKPIETLNVVNSKVYYNNIISSMFENSITLHQNKRCKTKEDQEKMKMITDAVRNSNSKLEAIEVLKKYFKCIYDKKDIVTQKNVCALNKTCEWVNSLIHKPFEGEVFYEGLDIICRKTLVTKAMKLTVNNTYEIVNVEDGIYWITDGDDLYYIGKDILEKHFRLSYARTCHSYQGMSEDDAICIFDINHFMVDIDWIYTAITRSTCIDNIYIYLGKTPYQETLCDLKSQIRKMIDGHYTQDYKKDRLRSHMNLNYVNVNWTMKQLFSNKCSDCHKHFDVSEPECFSIDRIDNNLGHFIFNCRVICRRCNVSKK